MCPLLIFGCLVLLAAGLQSNSTQLICTGDLPTCFNVSTYRLCIFGCSVVYPDVALVLTVDQRPSSNLVVAKYPQQYPPWNFHAQATIPDDMSFFAQGVQCGHKKVDGGITVQCHLPDHLINPASTSVRFTAQCSDAKATRWVRIGASPISDTKHQQCVSTPMFGGLQRQMTYLSSMRQEWGKHQFNVSYIFARTKQKCDFIMRTLPNVFCTVIRKLHYSLTPYYDQAILSNLCRLWGHHSGANFLVLTDLDELPMQDFGEYLQQRWDAELARGRSAGFLIWFDADGNCPIGWCPRNESDRQQKCGRALRLSTKPVIIPKRVQSVSVHYFRPKPGFHQDAISYTPCLRHVRKTKCWSRASKLNPVACKID